MKRKDFLKKTAIAGLTIPAVISACSTETTETAKTPYINYNNSYKWTMVTTWPPNFPALGEGCNLFADIVKEMSGGRMTIRVFGGGELIPALEVFDAVSTGTAHMGHGCSYYWAGKAPAAQFFASVPFGLNAQQHNAWIMNAGGQQLWEELYANYNMIPMLGGNSGMQMGGWFNKEINSIEDYKGLKMRIPGLGGKVLEKAGGTAVLSAGSEIYTNLERGVIDATEWLGPYHDYKMGFHKIAKYYYTPGWHELGTALEFTFNKPKFEALPTDLQAIMKTAAAMVNSWMLNEMELRNAEYFTKILAEGDLETRTYSPEILNQLKGFAQEAVEELASKNEFAQKVFESFSAYKKTISKWGAISEKVFYNTMGE